MRTESLTKVQPNEITHVPYPAYCLSVAKENLTYGRVIDLNCGYIIAAKNSYLYRSKYHNTLLEFLHLILVNKRFEHDFYLSGFLAYHIQFVKYFFKLLRSQTFNQYLIVFTLQAVKNEHQKWNEMMTLNRLQTIKHWDAERTYKLA